MDEAGRGPVIGPIVFGLVVVNQTQEQKLKELGIDDSKMLSETKRNVMKRLVLENAIFAETYSISAQEINEFMSSGTNLNKIEIIGFKKLLSKYEEKIDLLQLDAADVNAKRFGSNFEEFGIAKIDAQHKGDSIFVSVGSASILAKVNRDDQIKLLQQKMNKVDSSLPNFGSGYPTDATKFLVEFYNTYKSFPTIARTHWKTCKRIKEESDQRALNDYF